MTEYWKDIDCVGYYQVSNLGRVKSTRWNRILTPTIAAGGYYYVGISINGKGVLKRVHRIVGRTFIPNPENKRTINHIDGNKLNNNVENLEWCTHKENLEHACKMGLVPRGEDRPTAILIMEQVLEIREVYKKGRTTHKKLAKEYGISPTQIARILKRTHWKHI